MSLRTPSLHPIVSAAGLLVLFLLSPPFALHGQALIGEKDFRISHAGPDGDPRFDAAHESVAYDPLEEQFFVVWDANTSTPSTTSDFGGKREVFGIRLDRSGKAIGPVQKLATAGPANDIRWNAANPEIVYNSLHHEFLLIWEGTALVTDTAAKTEIFARRLSPTGAPLGTEIRVSFTGPDSDPRRDSSEPAVTFNSVADEFLVAYQFEEVDTGSAAENEIHAQRLSGATGTLLGGDIRISRMGPDGDTRFDAQDPAVAFASQANEYLIAWRADDDENGLVEGEFEVFGQRLLGNATEVGLDDFRISEAGPDGDTRFRVEDPSIAYDPVRHRYLVSWTGTADLRQGEEVYGQLMNVGGTLIRDDFRLSDMGPRGNVLYDVNETITRYDATADEFFVAWLGEDDRGLLSADEREVFLQRISPIDGRELGVDDLRVSDMGPEGAENYDAFSLDIAVNTTSGDLLVVWAGDDDRNGLVDGETEIFGQRIGLEGGCAETDSSLCLSEARFRVDVEWRSSQGAAGSGRGVRITSDTGYFWFFDDANVELIIKVLDARAINGHFWVFYGALSDVEYTITVTDSVSGQSKTYFNPQGTLASQGDTSAFALPPGGGAATSAPFDETSTQETVTRTRAEILALRQAFEGVSGSSSISRDRWRSELAAVGTTCQPSDTSLCLSSSRFEIGVDWRAPNGESGPGKAEQLTGDTGYFWFFSDTNVELVVKVLDARPINGHFWVFYGALSDLEYTITVRDTETGAERTYFNEAGVFASQGDVEAF